jgi:hypothetical protein
MAHAHPARDCRECRSNAVLDVFIAATKRKACIRDDRLQAVAVGTSRLPGDRIPERRKTRPAKKLTVGTPV